MATEMCNPQVLTILKLNFRNVTCLIEAKATRTPMPGDARSLSRLADAIKAYRCSSFEVCLSSSKATAALPLSPNVKAITWTNLHACFHLAAPASQLASDGGLG